MQKICFNLILVLLIQIITFQTGKAQLSQHNITLKIGDKMPDLAFENILSKYSSPFRISDYKGKAMILDFWATWCVPCLVSFPKLEHFQKSYQDELKILLFSNDKREKINDFYKKKTNFSLPTACYDGKAAIATLFPHQSLPHYIWINKEGIIVGITDFGELTERNIKKLLSGELANMPVKNDFKAQERKDLVIDSIQTVGRLRKLSRDSSVLYESKIRKYDDRLTQTRLVNWRSTSRFKYIQQVNCSIVHLYQTAFLGISNSKEKRNSMLIEIADTTVNYPRFYSAKAYNDWEVNNSYSYYLTLTGTKSDSVSLFHKMQTDLVNYFGIKASFEDRRVNCLVLSKLFSFDETRLRTKGTRTSNVFDVYSVELLNQPINSLFQILQSLGLNKTRTYQQPNLPFVDETGLDFPIDLSINANLLEKGELNKALEKYGLKLDISKRQQRVLVLSNQDDTISN